MVGVTGFEPATPCTPCKYSTRLSYTPNNGLILPQQYKNYKYFFLGKHTHCHPCPTRAIIFSSGHNKTNNKKEEKCQNQKTNQANAKTALAHMAQTATKNQKWKKRTATNNKYNPRIIAGYFYSSLNNRAGSTALLPRRTSRYISGLSGFIRPMGSPARTSCPNITSIFPRLVITVL